MRVGGGVYRGPDRRRTATAPLPASAYAWAASVVVVGAALVAGFGLAGVAPAPRLVVHLHTLLDGSAVIVTAVTAVVCLALFRLARHAALAWVGLALAVLTVCNLGVVRVLAPLADRSSDHGTLVAARTTGFVLAVLLFLLALVWPQIDAGLRVSVLVVVVAALAVAGTVTVHAIHAGGWVADHALVAVAFGALALAHAIVAGVRRRWVSGWVAIMLGAVALGRVFAQESSSAVDTWELGMAGAWVVGPLALLGGCIERLYRALVDQRRLLLDVQAEAEAARTLGQSRRAADRRQVHDARNSLAAVEGAVITLVHHHDKLGPEDRAALRGMLTDGMGELRRVVGKAPAGPFALHEAVAPVAEELAARGVSVHVAVPPYLRATGDVVGVGEAVRQACRAVGADDTVAWSVHGGPAPNGTERVALTLVCHGPTVRAPAPDGLALRMARHLAAEQGADLHMEFDAGAGSVTVLLHLPGGEEDG
ncbi:MAG TPA: hypothetical protein VFA94_09350 [Acidimicrobiales bacterium]|nr:hypothetical protein [Acidimicrobiales bacterium]